MNDKELRILKGALSLIYYYNKSEDFREEFNQKIASGELYQGRPAFSYIQTLLIFSPVYYRLYVKLTRTPLNRLRSFFKRSPNVLEQFLRSCYEQYRQEYHRLQEVISPPGLFSITELQALEKLESLPPSPQKTSLFNSFFKTKIQNIYNPQRTSKLLPKPIQVIKNLKLPVQKSISWTFRKIGPSLFSAGIGAIAGTAFGRTGTLIGGVIGGSLPTALKFPPSQALLLGGGKALLGIGAKTALLAFGPVGALITAASFIPKPSKLVLKVVVVIVAGLIGLPLLLGLMEPLSQFPPFEIAESAPLPTSYPPPIGSGCPDTSKNTDGFSCRYLNPAINIFNTSVSPQAVETYINKYSPVFINAGKGDLEEFKKRVNYIISKSQQGKLNPAIFLGYWKTESYFSTIGIRDMGCLGSDFYEQVRCALAVDDYSDPQKNPVANCARSERGDSPACTALKDVRKKYDQTHSIHYPIQRFDDFAEAYGPYDHLNENGQPTNCTSTYNKLIETAKELNACQVTAPRPTTITELESALLANFKIKFDSSSFLDNGLSTTQYQNILGLAWDVLRLANDRSPKFLGLIQNNLTNPEKVVTIYARPKYSERVDDNIFLSSREGSVLKSTPEFFKQNFIHELAHIINNGRPGVYGGGLISQNILQEEGYLTKYSASATPEKQVCAQNPDAEDPTGAARADEDFAESVSYFINEKVPEQNYGCGILWNGQNPYDVLDGVKKIRAYFRHYQFIDDLLK